MAIYLILRTIAVAIASTTSVGYALALPVLSALLVMLSGQPWTGQISRAFVPAGKAGETEVVVGAAATVLSSVHYQARLVLTCADESCAGNSPSPEPSAG
jgi:hypothetical protein